MRMLDTARNIARRLGAGLCLALVSAIPAAAATSVAGSPGIRIFSPEEVLAEHTIHAPSGALLFEDASGARLRFITSVQDPEIQNAGDGSFHPASTAAVASALAAIPLSLRANLSVDVYVLPYPRSGVVASSAGEGAIYLSPGVRPDPSDGNTVRVVTHELGHVFQDRYLPDGDLADWGRYRDLRGLRDLGVYHAQAAHANRPHEIFAEDFRALFGSAVARETAIENRNLAAPSSVAGLGAFFTALASEAITADVSGNESVTAPSLWPNPVSAGASSSVALRAPLSNGPVVASLFDAGGREVGTVEARGDGSGLLSLDLSPLHLVPGAYWLRLPGLRQALAFRVVR